MWEIIIQAVSVIPLLRRKGIMVAEEYCKRGLVKRDMLCSEGKDSLEMEVVQYS